jgi:hypothetical protein
MTTVLGLRLLIFAWYVVGINLILDLILPQVHAGLVLA